MTDRTDDILLSFTPQQYQAYLSIAELAKSQKVKIDITKEDAPCPIPDNEQLISLLSDIIQTTRSLALSNDISAFFISQPDEKEIADITKLYYAVVNEISYLSSKLNDIFLISNKTRRQIDDCCIKRTKAYQSFLPYKAALGDQAEYKNELACTEERLLADITSAKSALQKADRDLNVIFNVSEAIIPAFLAKSSEAMGKPPHNTLSKKDLTDSARAFCEQLKAQIQHISV